MNKKKKQCRDNHLRNILDCEILEELTDDWKKKQELWMDLLEEQGG